jgi:hydroxymethylbilane synthase
VSTAKVVIVTRGRDLSRWQANEAARLIPAPTEMAIIETSGDRFQSAALQGQLEQGFFTKEIEKRLLAGEIDVAVHSLKDLPTQLVDGLTIGAHLPRAAVSDLLIVSPEWHDAGHQVPLKDGTEVGAMSLRRQALLRQYCPQAGAVMIRGNVPSRIERCRQGEFGAVILARAGVERLGLKLDGLLAFELNPLFWPPAPGQGVVAVEARQ